jgi:hypothetical protein
MVAVIAKAPNEFVVIFGVLDEDKYRSGPAFDHGAVKGMVAVIEAVRSVKVIFQGLARNKPLVRQCK